MTVGIVGAGQLGRMLALAGYPLGVDCVFLDKSADTPGGQVAPILCGEFTDRRLLRKLASRSDVVTFDWENVSVDALRSLRGTRVCPPVAALAASQDRVSEKRLFDKLRIPTTRWRAVDTRLDLERAARDVGMPGVVKTRRLGYDGKGQAIVRDASDLARAHRLPGDVPLIYEELVPFDHEVSIIGARSTRGELAMYPLNGNVHVDGILRLTRAPFGNARLQRLASGYLSRLLAHFRYAGILTIEFFVHGGRLIANEFAPRVHNSGHWTIEGAVTSQFENHLRAILGLPLGSTAPRGHAAMVNIVGRMPARERVLRLPDVHLHDYGKTPRPGRKLGHCTAVQATARERDRRARDLLRELAPGIRLP